MNSGDGGLVRHVMTCEGDINWEEAEQEDEVRGNFLRGLNLLRQRDQGIIPLNSYSQVEQWQSTISRCFGD